MARIKFALVFLLLFILKPRTLLAQDGTPLPVEDLARFGFVAQHNGVASVLLNPAGLSPMANDDGVLLYDRMAERGQQREFAMVISLGNLAFAAQQMALDTGPGDQLLKIYRLNLAVGGRVLAVGTSNKLVQLEHPHHFTRAFSVDAGIHFQPFRFLRFDGLVLNCDQPDLEDYYLARRFVAGFAISLWQSRIVLLQQMTWNEHAKAPEDMGIQAGIALRPVGRFVITIGANRDLNAQEHVLLGLQIPLPAGLRLYAFGRTNQKLELQSLAAVLILPLQAIQF